MKVAEKLIFLFKDADGFSSAIYGALRPNPSSFVQRSEESYELPLDRYGIADQQACGKIAHFVDSDGLFPDIVILNKVDLVSSEDPQVSVDDLEMEIRKINSLANINRSVRCQVDLSMILNFQAYDASHVAHLEALLEESKLLPTKSLHDSSVRTLCICEPQTLHLEKVRIWIEDILWDTKYGMDVYRCKGVLSIVDSDVLHTLQEHQEAEIKQLRKKLTFKATPNILIP